MLNISSSGIHPPDELREFERNQVDVLPDANRMLRTWLTVLLVLSIGFMFLPWTQNIQSDGMMTTLRPEGRPQSIQATIAGQVDEWYVVEGQTVAKGDTILKLVEVKAEYLDPLLVERTGERRDAKSGSAAGYLEKMDAMSAQIIALQDQLTLKTQELDQKLSQTRFKIETQKANIINAENQYAIAQIQVNRSDTLFQAGVDPRSKLEEKINKLESTRAKLTSEQNKLQELENELELLEIQQRNLVNDTQAKIAKARSDRASAQSDYYTAIGDVAKLNIEEASYRSRAQFYYVIAPQDAIISVAFINGVGEFVKEGETLVTIVPINPDLAVELFVRPMDLPLIKLGHEVRMLFDGWPAVVFGGGWPGMAFGTFTGRIVAIDNNTNSKGEYRILVAPEVDNNDWPIQLRPGSGAQGIVLLSEVPLWYEIWRQLNGFPADYYTGEGGQEKKDSKAPIRNVVKR